MVKALAALLALAACHGRSPPPPATHGSASRHPVAAPPDAGLDVATAIPAWQAVVDRAHYLARRGDHGIVDGVVAALIPAPVTATATATASDAATASDSDSGSGSGARGPRPEARGPSESPRPEARGPSPARYTSLLDPTDLTGALVIRVRLPTTARVQPGDHIAVAGAWQTDADHRWFWAATALAKLPRLPTPGAPPAPIGHTIATGAAPAGAVPISQAKYGDAALFQLAGPPPALDGEGWPVADRGAGPVVVLLALPGEQASYGAQDYRSADERWHLERGATYWVRLGRIHHHGATKPATVIARSAPVRVR